MKRVLIVAPSFPPISAADAHRVRMSTAYYREFGWQPFILAVSPEVHGGLLEPDLLGTVPREVSTTRTGALPAAITRVFGVGDVGLRAWPHLYRAGAALIREHAVDLVFFSTTAFPAITLGRFWKARFGTPYVVDFQDSWHTEYQGAGAPRGIKAGIARLMHGVMEPFAMRRVDGIVSVSPAYADLLQRRYPWIHPDMCATIPFGVAEADFDVARRSKGATPQPDRPAGVIRGVSLGRGGADLETAARLVFGAVLRRHERIAGTDRAAVKLSFVGTDYSNSGRRSIAPIAESLGAGDCVRESPARVGYLDGLRRLIDADFTVILGSDDPAYSPSKVYPCLLTGRPFLAVLHDASPVVPLLRQSGAGVVVTFGTNRAADDVIAELAHGLDWIEDRLPAGVAVNAELTRSFTARELTARQCASFDAAIRHASPEGVPCVG